MASFGSFESTREVYSDAVYAVYAARKPGEPASDYAVKVFTVLRVGMETESTADLAPLIGDFEQACVDRISLQQKTASASAFISPVLETGRDERGVWYVTKFFPRSVNKILSGKVALNRDAMLHILRSIAQGALDFKRVCGRSHGDIRPSNVQISKSEKLSEAEVVLSDPLPGGSGDAERYESSDLRAIGRILLQLATLRTIGDEDFLILPVLATPDWTRIFGPDTEAWLGLCNRLLDPQLSLNDFSLEQLVATLDSLKPKSGVSPRLIAVAAGAVLVFGLLTLWLLRPRSVTVEITSDPPGATLTVDGKPADGRTPLQLKLKNGSYAIEARHDDLHLLEQSANLKVQPGSSPKVNFQFPYGSIAIRSDPPGAIITRDGTVVGHTPPDGSPFILPVVAPGMVKLQLNLDRHESADLNGMVTNRQQLVLSATLRQVGVDDRLVEFESKPYNASIYQQGRLFAETPARKSLAPGTYQFTAVYGDWPPKQFTVEVKKDADVTASIYFENGTVTLDSDPQDATVWIGTNRVGNTPKTIARPADVPATFRFEQTGFETTNLTVVVADKGKVSLRPVLLTTNGVFELASEPQVAVIYDSTGRELGRTSPGNPVKVTAAPGTYAFTARADGLADVTETLRVEKREINKHTFVFDYGTLQVDSIPPGASVSADGKAPRFTPATFFQKPGVKVSYRIIAPDYLLATNEEVLSSGETRPLLVRLIPEPVSVSLTSDPPGAQFFYGQTPLPAGRQNYSLPWGTNVLTAKYPYYAGLEDVTDTFVVRKGAVNAHEFKFDYGTVALETTPPDVAIMDGGRGRLLGRTPTNFVVRTGRVDYDLVYDDKTNHVGTNVLRNALQRLTSVFEIRRDYTNSAGIALVRVKAGFYVAKFEVTQEAYHRVMGGAVEGKPLQPVVNVTFGNAQVFCQKLSQMDGPSLAQARIAGWTYTLPTEAEWSAYVEADPAQLTEAVFSNEGLQEPKEIDYARKSFNRSGLFDLFGNVAEWCVGANQQPVTTGGSFFNRRPRPDQMITLVDRNVPASTANTDGAPNIGFRCILKPPPR